jgi:alpha-tubulin suppressor-like RCC1 family protein
VRIYRLIHADPTAAQLVATAAAADGQSDFDLAWTADVAGALGAGLPIGQVATGPVTVVNAANVVSVTGSAWFGAALTGDGSVYAWGWGTAIGSGSQNNPMPFVPLTSPPNDRIVSISSGYRSTATVSTSGLVYRYGDTSGRFLADTRRGAVAAAEGYSHTMVLTSGGKVYGWGDNFTLALRKDGTVWSWGSNNRGQLGLGPDAVTGSVYSATRRLSICAASSGSANSAASAPTRW